MTDPLARAGWTVYAVAPGTVSGPDELTGPGWAAQVPGTAASAVAAAEGTERLRDLDVDGLDWWWRTSIELRPGEFPEGVAEVRLDGVATHWTAFWDGQAIGSGRSMYRSARLPVPAAPGEHELALVCHALAVAPTPARPRAPWRSAHVPNQAMRWHRTSMFGRSTWGESASVVVGPYREVRLERPRPAWATRVSSTLTEAGTGELVVHLAVAGERVLALSLDGVERARARMTDGGTLATTIERPRIWWPHTHGRPEHYRLTVHECDTGTLVLDRLVGFRTIEADRADEGFQLVVNGIPVFARGVCWIPPLALEPLGPVALRRRRLTDLAASGANLVRVIGGSAWADEAFVAECTRLGLLLWQDCMLGSLAPPEEPTWLDGLCAEVEENLTPMQGSPCVAVVSGGNETLVQPVLMGLPPSRQAVPVLTDVLPTVVGEVLPGVPYLPSSPSGGPLPHMPRAGVSHYYGVGAYLRPLADARLADVRFAAECLSFGMPPERGAVEAREGASPRLDDPEWRRLTPRELGADWDFLDVSAHYARTILDEDPDAVSPTDPRRALDLLRAAVAHAVEATLADWRRPGSRCAGAIVHTASDLRPGAGWGLLDVEGRPKASAWAAARTWAPRALLVTDEGLNGIAVHVVNDGDQPLEGQLVVEASLLATGSTAVDGRMPVTIGPHSGATLWVDAVLGEFRDLSGAHRFGPPAYDTLVARLHGPDLADPLEAVHLLGGPARPVVADTGLIARAVRDGPEWAIEVSCTRTSTFVCIEPDGDWQPADNWFHLPAGQSRRIGAVTPGPVLADPPSGSIRSLNSRRERRIDQPG